MCCGLRRDNPGHSLSDTFVSFSKRCILPCSIFFTLILAKHCIHAIMLVDLYNSQGSTESTWYAWDFGDGSAVLNITGLSNAEHVSYTYSKHGDFVVHLTAANRAGRTVVTADIVVKGLTFIFKVATAKAVGYSVVTAYGLRIPSKCKEINLEIIFILFNIIFILLVLFHVSKYCHLFS